jgi:hypothetical protein
LPPKTQGETITLDDISLTDMGHAMNSIDFV